MDLFPELQETSIEDFRKSAQQNVFKTKSVEVNIIQLQEKRFQNMQGYSMTEKD